MSLQWRQRNAVRKATVWITLTFLVAMFVKPSPAVVTEPATDTSFPESLPKEFAGALRDTPAEGKPAQQRALVATGVRKKFGAIKVYAVGLYLDAADSLWGRPRKAKEMLAKGSGHISLRLVITSSLVTQRKLSDALKDAMLPQMSEDPATGKALEAFEQIFAKGPKLKPGTVILLDLGEKGVKVGIDGRSCGEVRNAELGRALLAVYLGENAVAPQFRDNVLAGLADRPRSPR
mmetsp:Transcript_73257/g.136908  ORF Transcript_73257/g.136908 Transcript_73257/m.136908 type:complete len:234 (+) Transcript_73257:88-789(+)